MCLQSEAGSTGAQQTQVPDMTPGCSFPQLPDPFWNRGRQGPEHSWELTEAQQGKQACQELTSKSAAELGWVLSNLGVKK